MKGYRKSLKQKAEELYHNPSVIEMTTVGCMRCHNTWREERTFHLKIRINGPLYDYDFCEECSPQGFYEEP